MRDSNTLTPEQAKTAGAEMRLATAQHAHKHRERLQHWFAPDILDAIGSKGPKSITEWTLLQEDRETWGGRPCSPLRS